LTPFGVSGPRYHTDRHGSRLGEDPGREFLHLDLEPAFVGQHLDARDERADKLLLLFKTAGLQAAL